MSVEILGQQAMETRWVVLIEIQTKGRAIRTLEIATETVKIVLIATITEEDLNNLYGII
jgi:3-dehydroquinate synthase class II